MNNNYSQWVAGSPPPSMIPHTLPSGSVYYAANPSASPADDPREVLYIRAQDIFVDQNVQRAVTAARRSKLQPWIWSRAEVPTVVIRPAGSISAVEGQHRIIERQAMDPAGFIWCVVATAGTLEEEAAIAYSIAVGRSPHTPLERWEAHVHADHERQVKVDAELAALGLVMGDRATVTQLTPGSLSRVVDKGTPADLVKCVSRTVSMLRDAFTDQDDMFSRHLVQAVAEIAHRWPTTLRDQRLVSVLKYLAAAPKPGATVRGASYWLALEPDIAHTSRWNRIAGLLVERYNSGLQDSNKLKWDQ